MGSPESAVTGGTVPVTESEPGYRCAAHRGGCANRVDHPLTVCKTCLQAAGIELEADDGREPDAFQKDWTLSEHGYGQEDWHG